MDFNRRYFPHNVQKNVSKTNKEMKTEKMLGITLGRLMNLE